MKLSHELNWVYVGREDLPALLDGEIERNSFPDRYFSPGRIQAKGVGIAFRSNQSQSDRKMEPLAIVVDDQRVADVFSWLDIYAEHIFPISQFARVLGLEEWVSLHDSPSPSAVSADLDVWANVVLGEILAQGDIEENLITLPLSRMSGTFTATTARCFKAHGQTIALRMCADRLRALESDYQFTRRPVSVDGLMPIWFLASNADELQFGTSDAVEIADRVWSMIRRSLSLEDQDFRESSPLLEFPELGSDSVESRVVAFRHLEAAITGGGLVKVRSPSGGVRLALAAFLVGRGSSHHFLLARTSKQYPETAAWFGLFCGLCGSGAWTIGWRKAVGGIRKQLRSRFDWADQSQADLCWQEYQWVTKNRGESDRFASISKLYPRLLSIEILPGVICQLRFKGAEVSSDSRTQNAQMPEASRVDLLQAIDLLQLSSQKLVKIANLAKSSLSFGVQEELPLLTPQSRPITARRKKPKGTDF